jgi:hypothetical protein
MAKTFDSLSSRQRLDESFSQRALHKNLTGQSDVEIDPSTIVISSSGQIQPASTDQQGGSSDSSNDEQ